VHAKEYSKLAGEMLALAETMPGFIAFKTFAAEDGERVSIVEFADHKSHHAWRKHPRHLEAQRLGRDKFYNEFRIQVCTLEREYGMPHA
jgi:heme-degrading monooxygenase HmoA